MDYQRERLWGESIGLKPPGVGMLTALFAVLALTAAGFLATGEYRRKAAVTGVLVSDRGTVQVRAPAEGVVERLLVGLGDRVGKGEAIVSIRSGTGTVDGTGVTARLLSENRLQADIVHRQILDRRRILPLKRRQLDSDRRGLLSRQEQLAALLDNERAVYRLLEHAYQRQQALLARGSGVIVDVEQIRMRLIRQASKVQQLRLDEADNTRSLQQNGEQRQLLQLDHRQQLAELDRALSRLQEERVRLQARQALTVVSPVTGTVAVVFPQSGQAVSRQQPLLALIPEDSMLEAELYVPSRAAGFLAAGLPVDLRVDAFPYQKFGAARGRVRSVSRTVQLPGDNGGGEGLNEPFYKVSAALEDQSVTAYGRRVGLRPGMQLHADIQLESRSLLEWLLEPLFIRGRGW